MSDDKTYRFGDCTTRPPEDDEEKVPCAKCGRMIGMHRTRCPHCGIHFSGEAFEFRHPGEAPVETQHRGLRCLAWLILTAFLVLTVLALWTIGRA